MALTLCVAKTLCRTPIFQESRRCGLKHPSRFLSDNLKNKFTQFQRDDGTPIYLKGGFSDKVLFVTSCALCVIGVGNGIYSMLLMAFPKKS